MFINFKFKNYVSETDCIYNIRLLSLEEYRNFLNFKVITIKDCFKNAQDES